MEKLKKNIKRLAALISASLATDITYASIDTDDKLTMPNDQPIRANVLNPSVPFELAAHRSHRSHSSHSSHSSHRSSSGGYGTYSAPRHNSTPTNTISTESSQGSNVAPSAASRVYDNSLSTDVLQNTIQRVQLALTYSGHYQGSIDGVMGPGTRAAITAYRNSKSLKSSGFIDAELLNSLGIKFTQ